MLPITIGGQMGSGCLEIGTGIARRIDGNYVELAALRKTTRRLDATVEAVVRKELSYGSRLTRIGHMLELWFSYMGRYPGDSIAHEWGYDPPIEWPAKKTMPAQITDDQYRAAIFETAAEYASGPSVVLGRRAGAVALREVPEVVHVGLFAPLDARIARLATRMGVGSGEAEEALRELERARAAWFDVLGNAHPHDESLYDIAVDPTDFLDDDKAAQRIASTALEMRFGSTEAMSDFEHLHLAGSAGK